MFLYCQMAPESRFSALDDFYLLYDIFLVTVQNKSWNVSSCLISIRRMKVNVWTGLQGHYWGGQRGKSVPIFPQTHLRNINVGVFLFPCRLDRRTASVSTLSADDLWPLMEIKISFTKCSGESRTKLSDILKTPADKMKKLMMRIKYFHPEVFRSSLLYLTVYKHTFVSLVFHCYNQRLFNSHPEVDKLHVYKPNKNPIMHLGSSYWTSHLMVLTPPLPGCHCWTLERSNDKLSEILKCCINVL